MAYETTRDRVETYFRRTATRTWEQLTSDAPVSRIRETVRLAARSLTIKRKILEQFTGKNLYPYSSFYIRDVKERTGLYWTNHFSTIGIIGMN